MADGCRPERVAGLLAGLVGADLRNLVNEAALLAARRNGESVQSKDVLDALETLVLGPARALVMSVGQRARVAYHEGGHALLGLLFPAPILNRVTIVPHGMALGVTYQRPEDDRTVTASSTCTRASSGRWAAAPPKKWSSPCRTTGAENDMQQATDLATSDGHAMGDECPLGTGYPRRGKAARRQAWNTSALAVNGMVQPQLTRSIRRCSVLEEAAAEVTRLLQTHRRELDGLTAALLEHKNSDEPGIPSRNGAAGHPENCADATARSFCAISVT